MKVLLPEGGFGSALVCLFLLCNNFDFLGLSSIKSSLSSSSVNKKDSLKRIGNFFSLLGFSSSDESLPRLDSSCALTAFLFAVTRESAKEENAFM